MKILKDLTFDLKYSHHINLGLDTMQDYDIHYLEYNKIRFGVSIKRIDSYEYVAKYIDNNSRNQLQNLVEDCLKHILINFDYSDFICGFNYIHKLIKAPADQIYIFNQKIYQTTNNILDIILKSISVDYFEITLSSDLLQSYYDILGDPYYIGENCEKHYVKKWFEVNKIKQEHPECFI